MIDVFLFIYFSSFIIKYFCKYMKKITLNFMMLDINNNINRSRYVTMYDKDNVL